MDPDVRWNRPLIGAVTSVCVLLVGFAYLLDLGRNPYGVFCDEVLIGLVADRGWLSVAENGFFYDHFGTVAGSLSIAGTVPFVRLLGLDEFSLRLPSAVFTMATALVLLLFFRRSGVAYPWIAPLVFLLSPLTIHLGRINFGHAPSLFMIALGYSLYVKGREQGLRGLCGLGGVLLGASAYGYPGFYVAAPLFTCLVIALELPWAAKRTHDAWSLASMIVGFVAAFSPIVFESQTNPLFMERFRQKDGAGIPLLSFERIQNAIQSYPKYFEFDYLFVNGEIEQRGAFILRHSVTGAGLLPLVALPLIAVGIVRLIGSPDRGSDRAFYPFLALALAAPIPDLLTTTPDNPPYTFSLATGMLCVPFLVAIGVDTLHRDLLLVRNDQRWAHTARRIPSCVLPGILVCWLLLTSSVFVFSTYPAYALTASGPLGWQAGPRDMVAYYIAHGDEFSSLEIEAGRFNQTGTLVDFYVDDPTVRETIHIGLPDLERPVAPSRLLSISAQTFEQLTNQDTWVVVHTVRYPNDEVAFYLVHYLT